MRVAISDPARNAAEHAIWPTHHNPNAWCPVSTHTALSTSSATPARVAPHRPNVLNFTKPIPALHTPAQTNVSIASNQRGMPT